MVRRFFAFLTFSILILGIAKGGDLQSGEVFVDGQSVTGARLNNAVNGATILPAFIINKSTGSPVSADSFPFYQAGSGSILRTTFGSLQSALLANGTFSGTTTISQAMVISGTISPTSFATEQDNYSPTGLSTATTLRLTATAASTVTGLDASLAVNGQIEIIHNIGSFNITLSASNSSSSSNNRFLFDADHILPPNECDVLQYDSTSLKWRSLTPAYWWIAPAFAALTDGAAVTMTVDPTKDVQNFTWALTSTGAYPHVLTISGAKTGMTGTLQVLQDSTGGRTIVLPAAVFTDGVTATSTTFTSATATFVSATDAGGVIICPGNIPANTTISSVTNGTTIVLSAAATTTASGLTFYLPFRFSRVQGGGHGAAVLSTAANSEDWLTWVCIGTNSFRWTIGKNFN